ncbi:hypothetical protein ACXR6G_16565 [Ancylomarina sp. YFZ004]
MNKTHIIFAITTLLSLISCDKETSEYPREYTSHSIVDITIKVYTKDGDISSNPIGKDFIERHKDIISKLDTKKFAGQMKATYTSDSNVDIAFENYTGIRDVHQEANLVYWEDKEISQISTKDKFSNKTFLLHKPLYYIESELPIATGFTKNTDFKHCYYLKSTKGMLKYPLIEILFKYQNGLSYFSENNNEFDKSCVSEFTETDTLLVQQAWLEMI